MNTSEEKLVVPKEFRYMQTCENCGLHKKRNKVVVGVGPLTGVDYMFVLEAPVREEDDEGRPLAGKSGALLKQLITQAGLDVSKIYFTNMVKCRTPDGRVPSGVETHACAAHLEFQISHINPKLLVLVGGISLQSFHANKKITAVHGQLMVARGGRKTYPILNPTGAMRNPEWRTMILNDLRKLKKLQLDETVTVGPRVIRS